MSAFGERAELFWSQAVEVWVAGAWAMVPLALIAFVLFGLGVHLHFVLRRKGSRSVPERTWRRWIDAPAERSGRIGRLLDFVAGARSLEDTAVSFQELRTSETVPFERDLRVMRVCVSAAPLVGLLGTVTGMLGTFGALATGSGGEKTMGLVAAGISEALITTETGLVIALPGLFFQYQLARRFEKYKAFLAHLESVCTQAVHRRLSEQEDERVRRAARARVAEILVHRLRAGASERRDRQPSHAAREREMPALETGQPA
jgi:biopolymer transport protein ExbB